MTVIGVDGKTTVPTGVRTVQNISNDTIKTRLCCLEGCVTTTSIGLSFFGALPTGILLVVYSRKHSDESLLIAGIILIILPVIILVLIIVLCLNKQTLKRHLKLFTKQKHNQHKTESIGVTY